MNEYNRHEDILLFTYNLLSIMLFIYHLTPAAGNAGILFYDPGKDQEKTGIKTGMRKAGYLPTKLVG